MADTTTEAMKDRQHFTDVMAAAIYLSDQGFVDKATYLWNMSKIVVGADLFILSIANYVFDTHR